MAKKTTPIITYTEILARAIRTFEDEIAEWHSKSDSFPKELIAKATEEPRAKLDALKTLYCIETGTEWV